MLFLIGLHFVCATHFFSRNVRIYEEIVALARFNDETKLMQLVNDLKDELFSEKVVKCLIDTHVDRIEGNSRIVFALDLVRNEVAQFLPLISDSVDKVVRSTLHTIQEALLL